MGTTLLRWTEGIIEFGARKTTALLVLIVIGAGLGTALRSYSRPFWYDEICTVIMCRLPNQAEIRKALGDAADTNPPGFYAVARAAREVVPDDHLGYRLPSLLGLLGTITGVYLILRSRVSSLAALVGAAFLLCTPLAHYASEARPYALVIFCLTAAVLAWQRLDDSWAYAAAFAAALAAAVSLHYYAILVWPAFALAETSLLVSVRRFRIGAWTAMLIGALPLLFFADLLNGLRAYYGLNFWAQPTISQIFSVYDWLFGLGGNRGLAFTAGLTAVAAYWCLLKTAEPISERVLQRPTDRHAEGSALRLEECVLALGLLWLPAIAVAAAKIGKGGMSDRYMLPAILGGTFAVGYLANKLPSAGRALLLVLLMMPYSLSVVSDISRLRYGTLLEARTSATHEVQSIRANNPQSDLPIVVSSGIRYLPMAYYTPDESSGKLFAFADPPAAVRFSRSDSVDLALLVLRRYADLHVENFEEFSSRHREFLLISEGDGGFDWWPKRLSQDGYTLSLLPGTTSVYRATPKP